MKRLKRKSSLNVVMGVVVFLFVFIPLIVSLFYGNVPFRTDPYFNNQNQIGTMYGGQIPAQPQIGGNNPKGISNSVFIPHYSSSEANYYAKKEVTFLYVLRNIVILLFVAILSMILDRKLGLLDGIFRR